VSDRVLHFTGDPESDALIGTDPLALLIGFALDQQVTVQKAFSGPYELRRRIGGLDAETIATMDPEALDTAFRTPPAPLGRMAAKVRALCAAIAREFGNDARTVWSEAPDGRSLEARLLSLPGIGDMKAKSLIAVLGKRFDVRPPGYEAVAPTGDARGRLIPEGSGDPGGQTGEEGSHARGSRSLTDPTGPARARPAG
jgi:uncharacterized HhH-GPD family protein